MKFFAFFFCFYFTILTALPTVRVIKEHFVEKCQNNTDTGSSKKNIVNTSNQKEKCLLNLTFNVFSFLVFSQHYILKTSNTSIKKVKKSHYHKNFIPYYNASIWQPPE